jgi:hypothetical protein
MVSHDLSLLFGHVLSKRWSGRNEPAKKILHLNPLRDIFSLLIRHQSLRCKEVTKKRHSRSLADLSVITSTLEIAEMNAYQNRMGNGVERQITST